MVQAKFAVHLSAADRSELERLIRRDQHSVRVINRARLLLKTNGRWSASLVGAAVAVARIKSTSVGAPPW
jgi:hypothetical protein